MTETGKGGFCEDEKRKVNSWNKRAEVFYHRQWDVITMADVEQESDDDEYPDDPKELNTTQLFDYMGVDKIVQARNPHQFITIGQRFRSWDIPYHDFTLRTDTGTSVPAEKAKYLNGLNGNGSYPSVYAHAKRWKEGKDFQHFHLINFKKMLMKIDSGELIRDGHKNNVGKDDTSFDFYEIENIRDKGCIMQSWGEGWKK